MAQDSYIDHVDEIEEHLGPYACRSREVCTLNGQDAFESYAPAWEDPEKQSKLLGRTPISLDRDRILYSDAFRRQDDKFHVLFIGANRLSRNYTSHAVRAAHVARSVSGRLKLNADLAEAIVLGSKVGGVPFLHRGKVVVDTWVKRQIDEQDSHADDRAQSVQPSLTQAAVETETLPGWIDRINSSRVKTSVISLIPWASGFSSAPAYSSGQESYWILTTNPFTRRPNSAPFLAETMYGIWRHSLEPEGPSSSSFSHRMAVKGEHEQRTMTQANATHEAVLARYCDDITWVLENLSEASRISALENEKTAHHTLAIRYKNDFSTPLINALATADTGKLYTYFIDDIVRTSLARMGEAEASGRANELEPIIGMSPTAIRALKNMVDFLSSNIFARDRVKYRNETLDGILNTALDVLHNAYQDLGPRLLDRHARLSGWGDEQALSDAIALLEDPVHRVQASVDLVSLMSDREIFELVGLE